MKFEEFWKFWTKVGLDKVTTRVSHSRAKNQLCSDCEDYNFIKKKFVTVSKLYKTTKNYSKILTCFSWRLKMCIFIGYSPGFVQLLIHTPFEHSNPKSKEYS